MKNLYPGTVVPVPMMNQKAEYSNAYHEDLDARSLSLDYKVKH